jgi:hypothetical protein
MQMTTIRKYEEALRTSQQQQNALQTSGNFGNQASGNDATFVSESTQRSNLHSSE